MSQRPVSYAGKRIAPSRRSAPPRKAPSRPAPRPDRTKSAAAPFPAPPSPYGPVGDLRRAAVGGHRHEISLSGGAGSLPRHAAGSAGCRYRLRRGVLRCRPGALRTDPPSLTPSTMLTRRFRHVGDTRRPPLSPGRRHCRTMWICSSGSWISTTLTRSRRARSPHCSAAAATPGGRRPLPLRPGHRGGGRVRHPRLCRRNGDGYRQQHRSGQLRHRHPRRRLFHSLRPLPQDHRLRRPAG